MNTARRTPKPRAHRPSPSPESPRFNYYLDSRVVDQAVEAFGRVHDAIGRLPSIHTPDSGERSIDQLLRRHLLPEIQKGAQHLTILKTLRSKIKSELARWEREARRFSSAIARMNYRKTRGSLENVISSREDDRKKATKLRECINETIKFGEKTLARANRLMKEGG